MASLAKRALVALAIGPGYAERFEQLCRKNWTSYAERHGYDIVVITDPIDTSERARTRSPAWQKCLVLGTPELAPYERVVWVDSDIMINPAAPSIVDGVPIESIGVTDEHAYPRPDIRQVLLRGLMANAPDEGELKKSFWQAWLDPGTWHAYMGLPKGQAHIVQTGVMVLSPRHHRALFEHVYRTYEDGGAKSFNYEMRPLSHEIQAQNLQHWISPKFNALVWWLFLQQSMGREQAPTQAEIKFFLMEAYLRNHFLHFAGSANLMPMIGFVGA